MGTDGQRIMQNGIFNPDVEVNLSYGKRSSEHNIYEIPVSVKETPFSKQSTSLAGLRGGLVISAFEDDDEDSEF